MSTTTDVRERPILMHGRSVRGILDGRKSMTRRVVKPQPEWNGSRWVWPIPPRARRPGCSATCVTASREWHEYMPPGCCPYGAPGDRLYPGVEVPGFPGYLADTFGRIWSQASGEWKRLSSRRAKSARYATVSLARDGKYPTRAIHRLVCEAYYGPAPEGLPEVRHLNGDTDDNAPDNLDWGSRSDNMADRAVHGTYSGEAHHAAVLTAEDVEEIRASSLPQRELARRYGVSQSTVQSARAGDTWRAPAQAPPPNMARWAARIWLEVTDVRVERVQEITPKDVHAEGIGDFVMSNRDPAQEMFARLWNDTNAHRDGCTWEDNPWCWIVSFRRIEP